MIRAQLAEFGIVLAKGIEHALRLVDQLVEGVVPDIPSLACKALIALAASVTDPKRFTSARQFAASLGLTPRADCSGGRERMGRISKMGDRYLRRLLINGMTSQLQAARRKPEVYPWVAGLLANGKPNKLVAVAMANKAARIAWVVMARGEIYRPNRPVAEGTA